MRPTAPASAIAVMLLTLAAPAAAMPNVFWTFGFSFPAPGTASGFGEASGQERVALTAPPEVEAAASPPAVLALASPSAARVLPCQRVALLP